MNQITREQAFDLAKYRYKLMDKEGNVYAVLGNMPDTLFIKPENGLANFIQLREIGMFYFILCRDLSQLTETIEHEGESFVPLIELAKTASLEKGEWFLEQNGCSNYDSNCEYHFMWDKYINGFRMLYHTDNEPIRNQVQLFAKLQSWHFNLGFPQETVKPL